MKGDGIDPPHTNPSFFALSGFLIKGFRRVKKQKNEIEVWGGGTESDVNSPKMKQ